tara:strand:- start:7648 stop:7977 length:330 start_codon:yes stop_codon:yes gene_type:complete
MDQTYYGNGELETEVIRAPDGSFSRYFYNVDGTLRWVRHHGPDGRVHRDGGPAVIWYFNDGKTLSLEAYYCRGQYHREGAPAILWYSKEGEVCHREWYLKGEEVSPNTL